MQRNQMTPLEELRIVRLYRRYVSIAQVAIKTGRSTSVIHRYLTENEIKLRRVGRPSRPDLDPAYLRYPRAA